MHGTPSQREDEGEGQGKPACGHAAGPCSSRYSASFDKALKEEEDEEDSLVGLVSVSTSVTPTPDSRRRQKALEAFALLEA